MKPQLTIEAFADWCEKQPAGKCYDFTDKDNCAVAQFLKSVGVQNYSLLSTEMPRSFLKPSVSIPQTFGALAARLRAVAP